MINPIDTYSRDGAVCPHCGHLNKANGDNWSLYSEEIDEWDCGHCSKTFAVTVFTSYSWTTEPLEGDEEDCAAA